MPSKHISLSEVPPHILEKLGKFVSNVGGRTFVINGLPPEVTGGVLARYSRAQTGLQLTLVNEFLDENGDPSQQRGSELMDRVLNAYGDDSVGELEGVHAGIEDISQLLTKEIEDRRIGGSPIEQSTRYVKYDMRDSRGRWRYLRPAEIREAGLERKFEQVNDRAFELYSEAVKRLQTHFEQQFPRENFRLRVQRGGREIEVSESDLEGDDEKRAFNTGYRFSVRCAALDVGRCILPASTLTHIGLYGNGRFMSNLLTHLKSGELTEARERGDELEAELNKVIPTFIKRNRRDPAPSERNQRMRALAGEVLEGIVPEGEYVTLMPDLPFLDSLAVAALYPHTNVSMSQIATHLRDLPEGAKQEIVEAYIGERRSRRDRSGRAIEAGYPLQFDLLGGFAEYRDLQRHRMTTQQRQLLTTELGFITPPEMETIGLDKEVQELVDQMDELNADIRGQGLLIPSQYATLFNHRMRFSMGMNLREMQHLSELRTQPAGHFSYRAMVMEMARQVTAKYPWAEKAYGFVNYSDPDNRITRAKEQSRIAGRNLSAGTTAEDDLG